MACVLTDVILVIDDRVEGDVLVLEVPLRGLDIVHALVGLDEALKTPGHHRAMGQSSFLTCRDGKTKAQLEGQHGHEYFHTRVASRIAHTH